MCKRGTLTKAEIVNELKNQTNVKVCSKNIKHRLKEKGLIWKKKCKKPYVSEKNRKARLAFAREHVGWSLDQWKRVVWSDESPFPLLNQSPQYVWRTKDDNLTSRSMQATVKHQKSINVWGWFSWNGVED